MKKIVACLLLLCIFSQSAFALTEMPAIHGKSAALFDSSGQLLWESNSEQQLPPASVTKIMTMLLTIEAVDRGEVKLEDMVTGSAYAASMGGTQIWLKEGEQLSLDDMLKAIAVASANDCAVAVAEFLGGSEEAFVQKMNQRAKELGMTKTVFVNANGLDREGEKTLTCARDIGLMSVELMKHPKILNYTTIWMDTIRNGAFTLANTNKMLKKYTGLNGLKTGYTHEAMYCISAAAKREGMQLIAVVMAAPTKEERTEDAANLLNYGFQNYQKISVQPEESLLPVPIKLGEESTAKGILSQSEDILIEKDKIGKISKKVKMMKNVAAPITQGQTLGEIQIYSDGQLLKNIPIVAEKSIGKLHYGQIFEKLCKVFFTGDLKF
jgi:D-alanyl-D-alanine carboxypeptidase (penicillin-binding protein 5/6)